MNSNKHHLNKKLIKRRAEWAREVGILNGMKDLGLVHVTAEGMANSGVSKGAQRAVQEESVVVKGQEVVKFRQLQDVNRPRCVIKKRQCQYLLLAEDQIKALVDNKAAPNATACCISDEYYTLTKRVLPGACRSQRNKRHVG